MDRPRTSLHRIPPEDLPDDLRSLHARSIESAGEGVRLEVFGNHPEIYRWYQANFYGRVFNNDEGGMVVDLRWKELIRLKLSLVNGCFVCNASNVPAALADGYSQEQIDAIGGCDNALFSPREQAVLALGDEFAIANGDPRVSPELVGRLRRFFTDAQILELAFCATMLSGWTKYMFAFDMISRECSIADRSGMAAEIAPAV